ncbi:rho guanine nucleotide exchange factor 10 [Elysia marginata]|uniref:Rho guanine nucleotide exchange factor 10 n=1 Tax=Elysia marginata TaxID=1093978 RepID=A0AAV4JJY9_9GAST|nr:rho guanine nucleotide exchange factor 10 [Elysia marginata]
MAKLSLQGNWRNLTQIDNSAVSPQSGSTAGAAPGTRDPHIYFELEKSRDGSPGLDSQGNALQPDLRDADKYKTAQVSLAGADTDVNIMPTKTSFGVMAKAKLLEATGFFQTGKKKAKDTNKDSGGGLPPSTPPTCPTSPTLPSPTNNNKHSSVASYDCLWPADVMAEDTPHAGTSTPGSPDNIYQLAKPLPLSPPLSPSNSLLQSSSSPSSLPSSSTAAGGGGGGVVDSQSTSETIYNTPILLNSALNPIPPSQLVPLERGSQSSTASDPSPTETDTDSRKGKLYYSSAPVPVFEDPSHSQNARATVHPSSGTHSSDVLQSSASSTASGGFKSSVNRGVQEGSGQAVPVDFIKPVVETSHVHGDGTEYSRLYFRSTDPARLTESHKRRLAEGGYGSLSSLASQGSAGYHHGNSIDEDDISLDWGSEFDDEEESVGIEEVDKMLRQMDQEAAAAAQAEKPLPPKPQKQKGFSPTNLFRPQAPGPATFYRTEETGCLPVYINSEKHPPPELPPCPEGLSENQTKRRMIIDLIISSERSYLESLERVIKDFERAILGFIPGLKSSLRPVFMEMREIISHHKMFQIELAESVKNWDRDEKIGDIFTASFSKTMLVRAYSVYVNNFAQGMEEIRSLQRTRQNFDDFLKFGDFGCMKCKPRRLLLMNDLIMCCKVIEKEHGGYKVEKLDLKWMAKLSDLELKDTALTPDMQRVLKKEPGKIHLITSQLEKPEDDPFHLYADLREMLHDYSKLEQVSSLLASLKRSYTSHGLKEELIQEVCQDLENMIQIKDEQLRVVNSCTIHLVNHSRSDKPQYVIQTQTAAIKEDWCTDLVLAKLAREKTNKLAWDMPASSSDEAEFDVVPAHFMKHVVVDRPKNYTKIRCASPIFLHPDKSPYGLGVQHLWVCSSTPSHGQVSVLSIHNSRPALVESFKACSCDIMAAELVPGCGVDMAPDQYIFPHDTVWVATAQNEILIFPLASEDGVRRNSLTALKTPYLTVSLKFVDERLFCGFENGTMNVFSRITSGGWTVSRPTLLKFGASPIRLHFIHEEDIWLSCGNKLYLVEIDSLVVKATHALSPNAESAISHVVKAGVGIWVSFADSAYIKLYHTETMENLQEISIGNFVHRIKTEKLWTLGNNTESLVVTSLVESKGLLWIGTSVGVVLTLPLPRLSDGVPLYRGRPSISLHAHRSPVKFLVALHCAASTLELNKNSSLRYTLRQRQSRRNIEREKVEFEESEKRKMAQQGELLVEVDRPTGVNGTTLLDCVPDSEAVRASTTACWGSEQDESEYTMEGDVRYFWESHNGAEGDLPLSPVMPSSTSIATQGEAISKAEITPEESCAYSLAKCDSNSALQEQKSQWEGTKAKSSTAVVKSSGAGVKRNGSLDDTAVVVRRRLSFRSELANRIMVTSRTMSRSHVDLASYANEVEMYYDYLLDDATSDLEEELEEEEDVYWRVEPEDGKTEKKEKKEKNKSTKDKGKIHTAKDKSKLKKRPSILKRFSEPSTEKNEVTLRLPLSDREGGDNPTVSAGDKTLPKAGTLRSPTSLSKSAGGGGGGVLRGTGMRSSTVRKANTNNAVIVLSGGDGYFDLDMSRSQFRTDDACVQLWLYKY